MKTDPEKIKTITNWPFFSTSKKEPQHFPGFAAFHRRFIKDCSETVAFHLVPRSRLGISVPEGKVLSPCDPALQFMAEVDASGTVVGGGGWGVLSQLGGTDGKLHPCVFPA